MPNPLASPLPARAVPGTLPPSRALWLQGLVLMSFLAASSAPSPLYAVYRDAWGFSPAVLTVVFASYAIAMLLALLVFGALSDYRGRREIVILSLVMEIGAMVLFWQADSVAWLLSARILQGVATGIAAAALGAGLVDLHPERGALVNSIAPMVVLGIGALGASVLLLFASEPTRLVFEVLLVAFATQLAAAFFLPETAQRRRGARRTLRPSLSVPGAARTTLARVLPVNPAQWALGGFYFSLGPTVARTVTGSSMPLVGGLMIAALSLSSALAIAASRRFAPSDAIRAGAMALVAGVLVTLAGMHWGFAAVALAGTVVAGAGFGSSFSGSLRSLVPLALPQERAGLMSAFFAASYLAFSIPAIAAGLLAGRFGLQPVALGYGLAVAALGLATLVPPPGRRAASA